MNAATIDDKPVVAFFCEISVAKKTGCLTLLDNKKKRIFWFKEGELIATKSNLKSENRHPS